MATKRICDLTNIATLEDLISSFFGVLDSSSVTKRLPGDLLQILKYARLYSNDEYLYAIVDADDTLIFGIKRDGSVDWAVGIPTPIQDALTPIVSALANKVDKVSGMGLVNSQAASSLSVISNDMYLFAVVDANDTVLFGVTYKGELTLEPQVANLITEHFQAYLPDLAFALVDANKNLLFSIDKDGRIHSAPLEYFVDKKIEGHNPMDYAYVDTKVEAEKSRAMAAEEDLQEAIDNINPTIVEGGSNNPDQQFLTAVNDAITLKDRLIAYNGYKRVYVRQGESLADKLVSENTIYVISFSHNLGGGTLNLPSGCVLLFDGGCVYNGTLNGSNTGLLSNNDYIFGTSLTIQGTWKAPVIRAKFFKHHSDVNELKKINQLMSDNCFNEVIIDEGVTAHFLPEFDSGSTPDNLLNLCSLTKVRVDGAIAVDVNGYPHYNTIAAYGKHSIEITGGGHLEGDTDEHDYTTITSSHEWCHGLAIRYCTDINIHGLKLRNFPGDGITIDGNSTTNSVGAVIENMEITHCGRQGISLEGAMNVDVNNCHISDIYRTAPKAAIDVEPWQAPRAQNIMLRNLVIDGTMGLDICFCDNIKIENIKMSDSRMFLFKDCKGVSVDGVLCTDATNGRIMISSESDPDQVRLRNVRVTTENLIYLQLDGVNVDPSCDFGANPNITTGPAAGSTKFENGSMSYYDGTAWQQF